MIAYAVSWAWPRTLALVHPDIGDPTAHGAENSGLMACYPVAALPIIGHGYAVLVQYRIRMSYHI
ncbi:hypothetical protein K445DRAFT_318291 [Daldinia sp. EC12]|nr:hypothetical protein K445DRAFT_318291 [Daldinia sp. EC12]